MALKGPIWGARLRGSGECCMTETGPAGARGMFDGFMGMSDLTRADGATFIEYMSWGSVHETP